ncbi:UNVERIFIED_ORG: hypothetical protein E4P37_19150 [Bacillus sp. AZ43]
MPTTREPTQSVVLHTLWRAKRFILVVALLASVCGYLASATQPAVYTAESRMVLAVVQDFDPLGRQSYADSSRFVANQVSVVTSRPVIDAAVRTVDDGTTREDLLDDVDVSASADADVIEVVTTGPTAEAAAERANALVDGYRTYVRQRVEDKAASVVDATADQSVIDQIEIQAASYGDGLAVVDAADPPTAPSGPAPVRDAGVVAVLAALVAAGLALLRRRPVDDGTTVPGISGVPVLGIVPARWRATSEGKAGAPEEFSLPLVSLSYMTTGSASPLVVTGTSARSGSAAAVRGLALVAADQGKRVLVVDAEPRHRELLRTLGAAPSRPLGRSADDGDREKALARVPLHARATGVLDVAAVGSIGAVALSDKDSVATALRDLARSYDLVLVHVGPVTLDAMAFSMLHHASVVVATMRDQDDHDLLTTTRERVELAGVPLVGVLVTTSQKPWRVRLGRLFTGGGASDAHPEPVAGAVTSAAQQEAVPTAR